MIFQSRNLVMKEFTYFDLPVLYYFIMLFLAIEKEDNTEHNLNDIAAVASGFKEKQNDDALKGTF